MKNYNKSMGDLTKLEYGAFTLLQGRMVKNGSNYNASDIKRYVNMARWVLNETDEDKTENEEEKNIEPTNKDN